MTPPTLEQIATPRTDKRRAELRGKTIVAQFALLEEHARQLERELAALQTATKQPEGADWAVEAAKELYFACFGIMAGKSPACQESLEMIRSVIRKHAPLVANREDSERLELLEKCWIHSKGAGMPVWGIVLPGQSTVYGGTLREAADNAAMRPAQPERGQGEGTT